MTTPFLKNLFGILAILSMIVVGTGCDSGGDDNGGGSASGSGSLTATVNGSSFQATVVTVINSNGVLAIGGNLGASSSTQQQINLSILNAAVGSFDVGFTGTTAIYSSGSSVANLKAYTALSGNVTITEMTGSSAKGTFQFTGTANDQTQAQVTNGQFDVNF